MLAHSTITVMCECCPEWLQMQEPDFNQGKVLKKNVSNWNKSIVPVVYTQINKKLCLIV